MKNYEIIKKNNEFQKVFEKGHSILSRYLVVYFLPNEMSKLRFGFCVGKKLGSAVTRNRIKRIMREAVRSLTLNASLKMDFILVARNRILNAKLIDVIFDLEEIISKIYKQCER